MAGEIRPKFLSEETNLFLCCQPEAPTALLGISKPKTFISSIIG